MNDADPKRILFVGRFDRHKGGDLIIDAFGKVLAQIPDARLWFVGPDMGYIDANGRTWHIEEYLRDRIPGALELKQVEWLGAATLFRVGFAPMQGTGERGLLAL